MLDCIQFSVLFNVLCSSICIQPTFSETPVLRPAVLTTKPNKMPLFNRELHIHYLLGELNIAEDKRVIPIEVVALFFESVDLVERSVGVERRATVNRDDLDFIP